MNKNTIVAASVGALVAIAVLYTVGSAVFGEKGEPPVATAPEEQAAAAPVSKPAPVVPKNTAILPAGTVVSGTIETHVSTRNAAVGDPVMITTTEAITAGGKMLFPIGTSIEGEVRVVKAAAETKSKAVLRVAFMRVGGQQVNLSLVTPDLDQRAVNANRAADAGLVVGGAVAGAVIGNQTKHKKGKEIGAVAGGVTGAVAAANLGANIQLKLGELATLRVDEDAEIDLDLAAKPSASGSTEPQAAE